MCFFGIFGIECVGWCFLKCDDEDCDYVDGCLIDFEVLIKRVKSGIVLNGENN